MRGGVLRENVGDEGGMIDGSVNVRLVFTLRREEPRCYAEYDDYYESDKRCPSVPISLVNVHVLRAHNTHSPLYK